MVDPFLYKTVDFLYHSVMDNMSEIIQERNIVSAFVLGYGGIYSVVRGLQWASRNIVDRFIWLRMPGFVQDRFFSFDENILPTLEKICIAGMVLSPLIYAAVDPEGAEEIVSQHSTYASGMTGVYLGSITGAVQDLVRRRLESYK